MVLYNYILLPQSLFMFLTNNFEWYHHRGLLIAHKTWNFLKYKPYCFHFEILLIHLRNQKLLKLPISAGLTPIIHVLIFQDFYTNKILFIHKILIIISITNRIL